MVVTKTQCFEGGSYCLWAKTTAEVSICASREVPAGRFVNLSYKPHFSLVYFTSRHDISTQVTKEECSTVPRQACTTVPKEVCKFQQLLQLFVYWSVLVCFIWAQYQVTKEVCKFLTVYPWLLPRYVCGVKIIVNCICLPVSGVWNCQGGSMQNIKNHVQTPTPPMCIVGNWRILNMLS